MKTLAALGVAFVICFLSYLLPAISFLSFLRPSNLVPGLYNGLLSNFGILGFLLGWLVVPFLDFILVAIIVRVVLHFV